MNRTFTLLVIGILFWIPGILRSQTLTFTEINYNDPSTGNNGDSLEFVEIYNMLSTDVDLSGYKLASGLTFTFPAVTIPGNGYLVIARNADAVNNYFGITGTLQWDAGQGLTNTNGEAVVLKDAANVTVDSVRYYVAAPWPTTANGLGSSLMKCDPLAMSNLASSWVGANITNANIYAPILNMAVFATPLGGCLTPPVYNPTYATLPIQESFDNAWVNGDNFRDVPSLHWKNIPAMGNNSWRRNDDGVTAFWNNSGSGVYSPTGASNSTSSARFHSAMTTSGLTGILQLYADFNVSGNKKLKFWYNNTAGTDSLALYMSEDGGSTFNYIQKFTTTTGWEENQIMLGPSTSTTVVLKFVATSNNTANDIGLDEVSVTAAPDNDAGIAEITSPGNLVFSGNQNLIVSLANYGSLPLTSVDIEYSVNGILGTAFPWAGDLASGSTIPGIDLGVQTIVPLTFATYKVWTSNPNGAIDGDFNNDTLIRTSFYQTRASVPFTEHFDSTWTDKYSTHDAASVYWINTPATGNNSWRRDDDGASAGWGAMGTGAYTVPGALGTIHSARFHTSGNTIGGSVGILDLYLDFSTYTGTKELRFYHINTAGNDSVAVWISYDNGTSFNYLTKYTVTPNWELKVVNLGNSLSSEVILRFRCTSNQGGNTDPGIDEVSIAQPLPDMAVMAITKPTSDCGLTNHETIKVLVKNTGAASINNIPVIYHLDGNTVQETISDSLNPGDTLTYSFNTTGDFSSTGAHYLSVKVQFPGDYNPLNDSIATVIDNILPIFTFPFIEDFETGTAPNFSLTQGNNATIGIESAIGIDGSYGLRMAGNVAGNWPSGSGTNTTPAQAWNTYTDHQAFAITCLVDGTTLNSPELKLDLKQTFVTGGGNKYSWFRVLINDTVQITDNTGLSNFNPVTSNSDAFLTHTFNLAPYANSLFKVTLQSSCKYNDAGSGGGLGDNAFIDNFIIKERPAVEIAMQSWIGPLSSCGMTSHETVSIRMKNQGTSSLGMIPVSYSIDGGTSWISEICPLNVQPDSSITYSFTTVADFSLPGIYNCIAVVSFPADADLTNDTVHFTVTCIPYITISGIYQQDFENTGTGWSSGSIAGVNEWVVGTPAKPNLNSAHSGNNAYVTNLTQNYANNTNTYVMSPCFDFTNLSDPYLYVWLHFRVENNYDAMIMEVSVNDSAWYKITADAGFYNNTSNQPPVAPPKWSGNNNGWTKYLTSLPGLANKAKVQIRFRFVSDNTQVDEGIAIDDIAIFDPFPDAGVTAMTSPVNGCDLTAHETVTITIKNDGLTDLVNIPVGFQEVPFGNSVVEIYPDTLQPGATANYTFNGTINLSAPGVHQMAVWANVPGDLNNTNNAIGPYVYNTTSTTIPLAVDFETTDKFDHLGPSTAANSLFELWPNSGNPNSVVMLSGGAAGNWPDDTATTAAQAWGYASHLADIHTCTVTINNLTGLWFDLKQTYSEGNKYSWFRVLVNDTIQIPDVMGTMNFNPSTAHIDPYVNHLFVLSPYGPEVKVTLQASCKYDALHTPASSYDAAFIDNFRIDFLESVPEMTAAEVNIYPNPASDLINLTFSYTLIHAKVQIFNMQGQAVISDDCSGKQTMTMDIKSLPAGVYAVRVIDEKEIKMLKFIKTR